MSVNSIRYEPHQNTLFCLGDWRVAHLGAIETQLNQLPTPAHTELNIDGRDLADLDSAGAWLIYRTVEHLKRANVRVSLVNFATHQTELFALLREKMASVQAPDGPPPADGFFTYIGKQTIKRVLGTFDFLAFIGEVSLLLRSLLRRPKRFQGQALLRIVEDAGYHALPIIALLSFLVGIVLAYQLGRQLETYGANIYIVDLSGMAILREFSPLITAIIVAGRTGSAFTAQIGLMKVNEELDALKTMGLSPQARIVIPRVLGTLIALPLLTMWSTIFAIFGSMIMARNMLAISPYDFLSRFSNVIDTTTLWTGLGKTPVFAVAIALVGCFQGFRVNYTAESIGIHTTLSVVQAIFLIIVIDAIFSVLYSWAGL